jgi:hypothetical protein
MLSVVIHCRGHKYTIDSRTGLLIALAAKVVKFDMGQQQFESNLHPAELGAFLDATDTPFTTEPQIRDRD